MCAALIALAARAPAQERGAVALGEAIMGLGVNTRVLMIGAHPDDEDTFLIAWLSRGRHVETAYLSLTRGDGGQNLIGNELGEALGVIRTEELLAARRVDGARQYFTRAYDFGFSKDTIDTYRHWQRDSILGDVIRVVRQFRPHVIVAVFSGTPRDGHGHHQVSGLLARLAYDRSMDTASYPVGSLSWTEQEFGPAWTVSKFYRAARFNSDAGTLRFDVGEYSPLLGRSFAEIAGESRSQHKSQGFGVLQRKGPLMDYLRREATRVNESTPAANEVSMFDAIDTAWTRFRGLGRDEAARLAIDSLPVAFAAARDAYDPLHPTRMIPTLARVQRLLLRACPGAHDDVCVTSGSAGAQLRLDFGNAASVATQRLQRALQLAAGLELEVVAPRETYPVGSKVAAAVTLYNRGQDSLIVEHRWGPSPDQMKWVPLAPGGVWRDTARLDIYGLTQPFWLQRPRRGGVFDAGFGPDIDLGSGQTHFVSARIRRGGDTAYAWVATGATLSYRFADPIRGEVWRPVAGVPAIAVMLDQQTQYARANASIDRELGVHLRSADTKARDVRVTLSVPKGLSADSATRTVRLERYDAQRTVTFRIRGRLPAGEHRIAALAESDGETFSTGSDLIDYDHIRRQRVYRPAAITVSAVDVRVPASLRVAYVTGVGDNVAPALLQLGIPVTILPASDVARADLQSYTTVVVGPRVYEAHPELVAANTRLFEFARKGGTLVVQYGQNEMTQPGTMPFPITIARPHDRVTHEEAPVTILDASAPELRAPNRIGETDFAGWVQERSLYMPRTFDARYRPLLAMSDPGEPSNRGAILVARLGEGHYIYTTLAFFRQLPAGVPGAARLFLNLLSAGISPAGATP